MTDAPELVYAAAKRTIVALDPMSGHEAWRATVPGGGIFGSGIVTLLVEGDVLLAGAHGRVSAFDRWTGERLWSRGKRHLGSSTVLLASAGGTATNMQHGAAATQQALDEAAQAASAG